MAQRLFLYIDILGFKDLISSGFDMESIFSRIDRLNVHRDDGFRCIVFSDTVLIYGVDDFWLRHPNQGVMWLLESAKDLFYRLISIDINIRAYLTVGDFEHYQLERIEAYYGMALVECYEREKSIKCTGVFIDKKLVPYCDIFKYTEYDEYSCYVHVMQNLDEISLDCEMYPIPGEVVEATGQEWWIAYLLKYIKNTHDHANDARLPDDVRMKHKNAWNMLSQQHPGLMERLKNSEFDFSSIVELDWSEPMRRIGTSEGAWG